MSPELIRVTQVDEFMGDNVVHELERCLNDQPVDPRLLLPSPGLHHQSGMDRLRLLEDSFDHLFLASKQTIGSTGMKIAEGCLVKR